MGKSKDKLPHLSRDQETEAASAFPSPFKDLKKLLGERTREAPKDAPAKKAGPPPSRETPRSETPPGETDDESILREAYADARPLTTDRWRVPAQPSINRNSASLSEAAEVLARLSDLVSGQECFDLTETEEYVEGARVGLDPRLITRLRRGEFALQDHVDLHGMIQADAKEALTEFILRSVRKGFRTVLVVHGRGRRSPGGHPVLKHAAIHWLSHGIAGAHVLAFTTARPSDGGAGAMYVLLRRDRRRAPFAVLHGAKRRD